MATKNTVQKKIFYILPGFGESPKLKEYRTISSYAKTAGYRVVPVPIKWKKNKTISMYINETADFMQKEGKKNNHATALGFSFGAYILALLSKKIAFEKVYFCSMAPYFKDDMIHIPREAKKYFGKIFMKSLSRQNFPAISKTEALFFVGEKDWPLAIERTKKSYEKWLGKKSKNLITGADHTIAYPAYLKKIKTALHSKKASE